MEFQQDGRMGIKVDISNIRKEKQGISEPTYGSRKVRDDADKIDVVYLQQGRQFLSINKKNLAKGKADRHANKETGKIGHRRDQMRKIQNKTAKTQEDALVWIRTTDSCVQIITQSNEVRRVLHSRRTW
jgi:hypothetical protein